MQATPSAAIAAKIVPMYFCALHVTVTNHWMPFNDIQ